MKKKIIITLVVVIVLLTALGLLEKFKVTNFTHRTNSPPPTVTNGPTNQEKQTQAKVNADNKKTLVETNSPPNPGPASTQSIDLSANSETNGTVTVFTKLYNFSSGTCSLTITNGSKQKVLTAGVIYQPEYSSCAGFSVLKSDLGTGTWNIKLSVLSNGTSYDKTISYGVN